jgi:hypothetical protein
MRPLYFTLGWLFFGVGFAGAFLPVVPTTPFMLVSLWCFSRSSPRFHNWLYNHKFFGPPLQQWHNYRVIPLAAKIIAVFFMTSALVFLYFFADLPQWITITSTLIITYGCWFILTKPSRAPSNN